MTLTVLITMIIGVQILAIGYLIKHRLNRIIPDGKEKGMAEKVGNIFILAGALAFFAAAFQIMLPHLQNILFFSYVAVIIPALGLKIYLIIKK